MTRKKVRKEQGPELGVVDGAGADAWAAAGLRVVRYASAAAAVRAAARGEVAGALLDADAAAALERALAAAAAADLRRVRRRLPRRLDRILALLVERKGEPVAREEIERLLDGKRSLFETRSVDTAVYRLRKRLGRFRDCLVTVPTRGFFWDPAAAAPAVLRGGRARLAAPVLAAVLAAAAGGWLLAQQVGRDETAELAAPPGTRITTKEYEVRLDFVRPTTNAVLFMGPDRLDKVRAEAIHFDDVPRAAGFIDRTNWWFRADLCGDRTLRLFFQAPAGYEEPGKRRVTSEE